MFVDHTGKETPGTACTAGGTDSFLVVLFTLLNHILSACSAKLEAELCLSLEERRKERQMGDMKERHGGMGSAEG